MKKICRTLAILSVNMVLASSAFAAGPRQACKDDAQKFCNDVQPGGGRIINCLQDHYKDLSDGCYSALEKMPQPGEGRRGKAGQTPQSDGDSGESAAPKEGGDNENRPDSGSPN